MSLPRSNSHSNAPTSKKASTTARLNPDSVPRLASQADLILAKLITAGDAGVLNSELFSISHALNQRISDLKRRGHTIIAKPEGEVGLWRYRLLDDGSAKPTAFVERRRQENQAELEREAPLFAYAGMR